VYRGEAVACQFTHPAGGDFNAQLPFRPDGELAVCPDSFDLHAEARDYVAILLEMYQFCPTLRGPESLPA
jgi:TetR/AcrR family acrAB operon transcriptional repressor